MNQKTKILKLSPDAKVFMDYVNHENVRICNSLSDDQKYKLGLKTRFPSHVLKLSGIHHVSRYGRKSDEVDVHLDSIS